MDIDQIQINNPEQKIQFQKIELPDLILLFGDIFLLNAYDFNDLFSRYPNSEIIGCSTSGEITSAGVSEKTIVATAIKFKKTKCKVFEITINDMQDSYLVGEQIGKNLKSDSLSGVMIYSRGIDINGSDVIEGIYSSIGRNVIITGGLAGDNGDFKITKTLTKNGLSSNSITAVGLYGSSIKFETGTYGGWSAFGPLRKVTRAKGNILYELDGRPALELYKEYLGEYAKDLPSSGLLFPFEMLTDNAQEIGLIRTILGIDEGSGSLILAGNIEDEGYLRLMHSSIDRLVDGAEKAIKQIPMDNPEANSLVVLVSCVGRKLVMGDQIDEEVEVVASHLGNNCVVTGFYSYGEIAPPENGNNCKLHNQTMTITRIYE